MESKYLVKALPNINLRFRRLSYITYFSVQKTRESNADELQLPTNSRTFDSFHGRETEAKWNPNSC